jgi:hypothetical protein
MPNSVIAAVLVIAAMTPGFAFQLTYTRFVQQDKRSTTLEVVELFSVGACTTIVAFFAVAGLGEAVPWLVDADALGAPMQDFAARPWSWFASCLFILAISTTASVGLGYAAGSRSGLRVGNAVRAGDGTVAALTGRSGQDHKPYLAVELVDGRIIEGLLLSITPQQEGFEREIVLQHPLAITGPADQARRASMARRIIVPDRMIQLIHVSYPELRKTETAEDEGEPN